MYSSVDDRVATLVLNRPHVLNCANEQWARDLNTLVDDLAGNERLRVVIVRGAGRAFRSGHRSHRARCRRDRHDILPELGNGTSR